MRVLILTDSNHTATLGLIRATLRLAARRGDEVCAVVTGRPEQFHPGPTAVARAALRRSLVLATSRRGAYGRGMPLGPEVRRAARRHGVPVVSPPRGDLNDPGFVDRVAEDLRPDLALSFYCLSVLRRPFLDALGQAVNFHDGLLPRYRGLNATAFALYEGEPTSGFAFHRMDETLDTGRILLEGAVPVAPEDGLADVSRRKAAAAVAALPAVLDRLAAGDPGRPQSGGSRYLAAADGMAMRSVPDPGALTADEVERRVRAFCPVQVTVDGRVLPVTRVRRTPSGGRYAFRSADGVLLRPDRLMGLPPRTHQALHALFRGRDDL